MALDGRAAMSELKGNELAETTLAVVDRVRPHVGIIVLAMGVVFAVIAGLVLVRSQQAAEQAAGWQACIQAIRGREPGGLEEVAVRYRGTSAGWWSELVLADIALADGNGLVLAEPAQAKARLAAAADLYTSVNAQRPTALAAERGIFGLARTRESQGQLDEARRGYEALVTEYPESPFKAMAEARLAALGLASTQRWYKWFETPPVAPPNPPDEPSGDTPPPSATEPAAPTGEPPTGAGDPPAKQPSEPPAG